MKLKAIKVLKALAAGQEVEIDGRIYSLGEYVDGGYGLSVKGQRWSHGKKPFIDEPEIMWLDADMPLNAFLDLCEKISDDDLFILAAEKALTEINREGGPSRI